MTLKSFCRSLLILLAAGVYLFSAVRFEPGRPHHLQIDLDRPLNIVWPCEVAIIGDLGEKGLRIGANIGRGWRGEAAGHATYRFYIPAEGFYTVWAYAKWFDECANAVFAQFDDLDKTILGNDPVYGQWHWVRGFNVDLARGTHNLILSNHSDHIAIEKLFLTNSALATPQDSSNVFADIFYEGFDGCDQGNFSQWQILSGRWQPRNPFEQMCFNQNVLEAQSTSEALIVYPEPSWSNYSLQLSVFHPDEPQNQMTAGICLGWQSSANHYQLTWQIQSDRRAADFELFKIKNSSTTSLTRFQSPWLPGIWHDLTLTLQNDQLQLVIDRQKPRSVLLSQPVRGGIGLLLKGNTTAYFDNIHVRQTLTEKTSH